MNPSHSRCFFWMFLSLVLLNLRDHGSDAAVSEVYDKECPGSENKQSYSNKGSELRYEEYRTMYTNCTIVKTNVEIVSMRGLADDDRYDFDFLQNIREVTGYVLIVSNTVSKIRLSGLRLIRGKILFPAPEAASSLYVAMNAEGTSSSSRGLKELQMNSLEEIMNGDVVFKGNSHLCLGENSIDWKYMFTRSSSKFHFFTPSNYEKKCPPDSVRPKCNESCEPTKNGKRYCWGQERDMCQKLTSTNCDPGCRRCNAYKRCCHRECAAGCTGPHETECLACNNFTRDGKCVDDCNVLVYNPDSGEWEPKFATTAFAHLSKCVDKCPTETLQEGLACVTRCSSENRELENGTCVRCSGTSCPHSVTCNGTGTGRNGLNSLNIRKFINCTYVKGGLSLNKATLYWSNAIAVEKLKFLSDIQEIRDFLEIEEVTHPNFTSLSFLGNLRLIVGNKMIPDSTSLVFTIRSTGLETLELRSLKEIRNGHVLIEENEKLCFVDGVNWTRLFTNKEINQRYSNGGNSLPDLCKNNNKTCSDECTKSNGCWGSGPDQCLSCRNYSLEGTTCVPDCDFENRFYVNVTTNGENECRKCPEGRYTIGRERCLPCDDSCRSCVGSPHNCTACRNKYYMIQTNVYLDVNGGISSNKSNCVDTCPEGQYPTEGTKSTGRICVFLPLALTPAAIGSIVGAIAFLGIVIVLLLLTFCRYQKNKRDRERLVDEIPVLSLNKTKPDMSLLRLVKESELRRGHVIGSGAFGTVYKGIWIPEKEQVKVPVAIKVLQESTNAHQNVELLDEARIMASVCHPCCVRILAVCMTAQMMLVSQLMPLGSLLEYVRKEKSNIGSRALLLWSVQIAKGMKYLEELGIVHRDLAARNVLVQQPNQVKITDFGLAKLLDYEAEAFHSDGEKMPIKWLAMECIQFRNYTHKSDVWSYGVTLWEMFAYGEKPYEKLQARQIPHALEKGERLPQPKICTIDVFMVLLKCWMLDADSRPTFSDLVSEFTKMAQDPGRFLVIPGDVYTRLASDVPDGKDLIRMTGLPVDELDFRIVNADDYLGPTDMDFHNYENARGSPSSREADYLDKANPEDTKEAGACRHEPPPLGNRRTESQLSQRYTDDPSQKKSNDKPNEEQLTRINNGYLDLVPDEADISPGTEKPVSDNRKLTDRYPDPSRLEPSDAVTIGEGKDNPEYFMMPDKTDDEGYLTTGGSRLTKL